MILSRVWKIPKLIFAFWGLYLLFSPTKVFAENSEIQSTWSSVQDSIDQMNRINPNWNLESCPDKAKNKCGLAQICRRLNASRKLENIYTDSKGHSVPNMQALRFQFKENQCRQETEANANESNPAPLNEDRFKEIQNLFNEKIDLAEQVLRKRIQPGNRAALEAIIARLRKVQILKPDSQFEEKCDLPAAAFVPRLHSVMICPQLLNLPNGSLDQVLSHEIAHAFDPCNLSEILVKVGEDKSEGGEAFGSYYENANLADIQKYQELGQKVTRLQEGIPFEAQPFGSVINCLRSKDSIRSRDQSETLKIVADANRKFKKIKDKISPEVKSVYRQVSSELEQILAPSKDKSCTNLLRKTQLTESFADWMSAEIISQKLEVLPQNQISTYLHETSLMLASEACLNLQPDQDLKRDTANMRSNCTRDAGQDSQGRRKTQSKPDQEFYKILKQLQADIDEHPAPQDRINRIYLAHPSFQKFNPCFKTKDIGKHCE